MLAAAIDYLKHWWWAPAALLFMAGTLWLGGTLLHRGLRRQDPQQRISFWRCVLAIFLAAGVGGMAGGAIGYILKDMIGSLIVAACLAIVVVVGFGYLTIWAMFKYKPMQLLRAYLPAIGATAGLGLVLGIAAGVPAYFITQAQHRRDLSAAALLQVYDALSKAQDNARKGGFSATPPANLNVIREDGFNLDNIRALDHRVTPFYCPPDKPLAATADKRPVLCEQQQHDGGRTVVYSNRAYDWLSETEFQALLNRPENKAFSDAFRAATK